MTRAHLTIDGNIVLNGDLGQYHAQPPESFAKYLTPGARNEPGMKELLVALADAAASNHDLTASLHRRESGFDLTVDHAYRPNGIIVDTPAHDIRRGLFKPTNPKED